MSTYQQPLMAILGEPGERDEQGFSQASAYNVTTSQLRPITVTDASGMVIYRKQIADNAKAADNHVRNAGYRRTGPWVDGRAAVELLPLGAKLKKPLIVLVVLAIVVAAISIFVARSYAAAPEAAQRECHSAVNGKLRSGGNAEFRTTTATKNSTQAYGGYLYVVTGEMRAVDGGQTRDMTYRCDAYVDSSGGVHKVTASTTWK